MATFISYYFVWSTNAQTPVNFVTGDAKDYYSYLISIFIDNNLTHQTANDWFIIKTSTGTINVHSIGVSLLLMPFFLIAFLFSKSNNFLLDGLSLPFQISISVAAIIYLLLGLIYIKKLLQLNNINDKVISIVILLLFFGTNLLHYSVNEAAMSHVYSFSLISIFLYHSSKFISLKNTKNLIYAAIIFGFVVLIRPNNVFIILSLFIWFKNKNECILFFKNLIKNKFLYYSVFITALIVFTQGIVWYMQNGRFIQNTYKADGFYWDNPQILKMLFGFDNGFFIYTPLCFLLLFGLIFIYKENIFSFFAITFFLLFLIYFFASFWAYTYFDGLGIRVFVDYYALFAIIGAKLFNVIYKTKMRFRIVNSFAIILVYLNLIYVYQSNQGILQRSGMTYNKWKYVFLKTDEKYKDCLGGSFDYKPFSTHHPAYSLNNSIVFSEPFNYKDKDFGVVLTFDSIGFISKRIFVKINCTRKEMLINASKNALICFSLEDNFTHKNKSYGHFKLNETPSKELSGEKEYNYSTTVNGDFKPNDKLSVYIWNIDKQPFFINNFSVQVYNYNYQIS